MNDSIYDYYCIHFMDSQHISGQFTVQWIELSGINDKYWICISIRHVFRDYVTNIYAQAGIVGMLSAAFVFLSQKAIRKITK